MKIVSSILAVALLGIIFPGFAFAQASGDYRSAVTGNWSVASTWETYDGTNWVAATTAPTGTETITVDAQDTVKVDIVVSIAGYVKVEATGVLTVTTGSLAFGDGSTYEHARDAGSVPIATWGVGSTFLLTGTVQDAPANRNQNFYNVTFNTPNLGRNRDMSWNNITIGGNVRVIATGANRWQMTSVAASDTAAFTIMGDVILESGNFAVQGTSNALTTFIINHFGNIIVSGGNFSVARGSQGNGTGTTTWYLHEGDFSMSNATTQNSNPTPGNAKFVFASEGGVQNLTLSNMTYGGGGLSIQVDSAATLNMDTTAVGGSGIFTLSAGATLASGHPDGIDGNLKTSGKITLSKHASFTFNGVVAQVPGTLLPDSVIVLTISNSAGVSFSDTLRSTELMVSPGAVMQIEALGSVTADSGSVVGTIINKGALNATAPLVFGDGSVYEHARDGGSVPAAAWEQGSIALFTGITGTAPENRGQDYYNLTLNTPGLSSNRDLSLNGHTIGGDITVVNTGSARWQMVGGSSGTVTIMGDVIIEAGQFATQGTGSATNVVVDHYGDVIVTGGNFSVSRGSQASGTGTTTWNLHEGNFSMSNATTQNSNPTPGNAKFVFTKNGGTQNLILSKMTYGGGGLSVQVDSTTTLNMDTTAVGGSGIFTLSAGATLASAHPKGIDGNLQTTGAITFSKLANFTYNGIVVQSCGSLLPDSLGILTIDNIAGVSFNDTLLCLGLMVYSGALMNIDSLGSITANSGSVDGTVVNKGALTAVLPLVFGAGSVYEHARDEGSIATGTWNEGSTLLMTGTVNTAPGNRNQSYYNITFNTPRLASNRDMGLDDVTIGGDIKVVNTGNSRWRLTSALAGDTAIVTIMGDVIVENGSFETQGTGNALTVFEVHHYGDVLVTGGNFSVARGSQGSGTGSTRWYLHEGDFSMSNATTQNSNPTNAWFVFDKADTQTISLASITYGGGGLAIEVASGTTLDFGASELGCSGLFTLDEGATLATTHAGGIAGAVQSTGTVTLNQGASYIFNGTIAQVTSALMPVTVNNLAINNAAGVILSQQTLINGVLRLVAGEFDNTIPFALGPNGSISYEGGSLKYPLSVEDPLLPEIPTEFALMQNYPNPSNPSTTIGYDVPKETFVTLKVYDLMGHEIAELVNQKHDAGAYQVIWNANGVASGVYFYQITAGDFTAVRKLILMK